MSHKKVKHHLAKMEKYHNNMKKEHASAMKHIEALEKHEKDEMKEVKKSKRAKKEKTY